VTEQSAYTFSYFTDLMSAVTRTNKQQRLCRNVEPFALISNEQNISLPVRLSFLQLTIDRYNAIMKKRSRCQAVKDEKCV